MFSRGDKPAQPSGGSRDAQLGRRPSGARAARPIERTSAFAFRTDKIERVPLVVTVPITRPKSRELAAAP